MTVLNFTELDVKLYPQSLGIVEVPTSEDQIHKSNTSRAGGSTMLRLWESNPESISRKWSTVHECAVHLVQAVAEALAERPLLAR